MTMARSTVSAVSVPLRSVVLESSWLLTLIVRCLLNPLCTSYSYDLPLLVSVPDSK